MVFRILFTLICILQIHGQAWGWMDPPPPAENQISGYVLLQNGNVLKGRISRQRDKIAVTNDGSTLYLDPKQIEFNGTTLESLYMHQREGIRVWGTGEHWHLAHWCIQNGLISHAIAHYHVLESTASDSPKFKQLEHLLKEAIMADEKVRLLVQPSRVQPSGVIQPQGNDAAKTNGTLIDTEVIHASAEVPNLRVTPNSNRPVDAVHRNSWVKHGIPSYIRKTFQTSVLPVLVSRCGQSGCHGLLGKSEFHIYQPVGDQAATVLAQDLDSVLRYVNREHVQDSELLAFATQAHGIQKNPSLNPAREDERALVERIQHWIKSLALTQRNETTMPPHFPVSNASHAATTPDFVARAIATSSANNSTSRNKRSELMLPTETQDRNAKLSKPIRDVPPAVFLDGSELSELEMMIERLEKKSDSSEPSSGPSAQRDPFDPNVFNQKYR